MSTDLTLRKIAIWLSKNCQKLRHLKKKLPKIVFFFQKNCQWQFSWKKWQSLAFFFIKCQVFGNFFTFKWQFSWCSGLGLTFSMLSVFSWQPPPSCGRTAVCSALQVSHFAAGFCAAKAFLPRLVLQVFSWNNKLHLRIKFNLRKDFYLKLVKPFFRFFSFFFFVIMFCLFEWLSQF